MRNLSELLPTVRGMRRGIIWTTVFLALGTVTGISISPDYSTWTYNVPTGGWRTVQDLLFQVAVATGLAVVVREMVERSYSGRMRVLQESNRIASRQQLLRSALGGFFSEKHLDEAEKSVFSSQLLRDQFQIEYNFYPHPASGNLVILEIMTEYTVTNKSASSAPFSPSVMVPNIFAYYPNDPVQGKPELLTASVYDAQDEEQDGRYSDDQIREINAQAARACAAADEDCFIFRLSAREILQDKSLTVTTHVRLSKLRADAETMRMNYPTSNIKLIVTNSVGTNFSIELSAIHARAFPKKRINNGNRWSVTTDLLMLPQNGWVLYWNDLSRNPSGLPEVQP